MRKKDGVLPVAALAAALLIAATTPVTAQPTQPARAHLVGYSVTVNAVCGTSGLFFLDQLEQECALYLEYGGGTAPVWWEQIGNPVSPKWGAFEQGIELNGAPSVIYWQIGFHAQSSSEISPAALMALLEIADEIRAGAPGATIYVSGMSSYNPFACERVNAKAVEKSWNAAALLWASAQDIRMGPVLPTITPEQTAGSGDPCHLGPLGQAIHGGRLHDFFDGVLAQPQ